MTVGKRGFDVRSRINFLKDSHDLACRSWLRGGSSRQGWVAGWSPDSPDDAASIRLYRTRRRDRTDGLRALVRCPRDAAGCPGWAWQRARRRRSWRLLRLWVEVDWDAQASRPRAGLLIYHFSTSYQATMSGTAYRDHEKPAVGRSEGRASAASGLSLRRDSRPERVKISFTS